MAAGRRFQEDREERKTVRDRISLSLSLQPFWMPRADSRPTLALVRAGGGRLTLLDDRRKQQR
jgi:hypothetical protein